MKVKKKIGIVVSRFNEDVSIRLLKACLAELTRNGVKKSDILTFWVPGSFEIPLTALKLSEHKDIAGVICLGSVIRGETLHYELVAHGVAQGIMQAALASRKPIIFGVLSTDTFDQANKRSSEKGENKGHDAAQALLSMLEVLKGI